jgi:hypothetical protein
MTMLVLAGCGERPQVVDYKQGQYQGKPDQPPPLHDPVSTVLMQAGPRNIDSVMIAGEFHKRDGQLLLGDLEPAKQALAASGHRIAAELRRRDARELGATADPGLPRFAQVFLDAADVAAVRAFWVAALGYTHDRRAGATDIHDPRRLNPVLVFQELDASETERRLQRNRIYFELAVPSDVAQKRVATTVAAGGRILNESDDCWRVADPEGNELVIVSGG